MSDELTAALGILTGMGIVLGALGVVSLVTWAAYTTVQRCQERTDSPGTTANAETGVRSPVATSAGRTAAQGADRGRG